MCASESTHASTIRVLIVDDHPIVRHGLSQLIAAEPDMEVCGQAGSMAETLEILESVVPDVAIVDISLGDTRGLSLIQEMRARIPGVKILVSSVYDERTYAPRALKAGAMGYVEKRETVSKITSAVRQVLEDKIYLSVKMADQLLQCAATGRPVDHDPVSVLSNRELEVFEMLGQGMTVQEIGRQLSVSPKTVESHRQKIKDKLRLKNSAQLNRLAFDWLRDQA